MSVAPAIADHTVGADRLEPAPEEPGSVMLWDNANIVESFPELTLPLTFSVAVELYAEVYRSACRALGVPSGTVEREARTFEQMLGLLQGRVYYNLGSWYRMLSLLPGFRLTAGFLEAMMGARRPGSAPDDRTSMTLAAPARARELATMTIRLGYRWLRFETDATAFRSRIAGLLAEHRRATASTMAGPGAGAGGTPGPGASPRALLAEFDRLRAQGLGDWRPPILNDLFLMLAHGALRRVADRWLGLEAPGLVNALLASGRVASARPAAELRAIATEIRARPAWSSLVVTLPPAELLARLEEDHALAELAARIHGYLDAWGDRAPRELQLDRPSYRDAPVALLGALRALVLDAPAVAGHAGAGRASPRPSTVAMRRVRRRLLAHPAGPLRLAALSVLLRLTRRHVRWREEMRLARGQLFGIGRGIFRELGVALCERGVLEQPADVHYLALGELRGIVTGTGVPGDPRELVRLRRARYATYASLPPLPSRLETIGPITDPLRIIELRSPGSADPPVDQRVWPPAEPPADPRWAPEGAEWHGTGAAVGRVRAPCLAVLEPTLAQPEPGRIIVARSTDPGWVPILAAAAGLAVEQGGLLSHSAIVARELGLPTVVGLPGLLDRVRDGDVLELDGWAGTVRLEAGVAATS